MLDIKFYEKMHNVKVWENLGCVISSDKKFITGKFEEYRSKEPVIYNIETTNACNMKCQMCPRTTMMTRKIESLGQEVFNNIVDQLRPWTDDEWERWQNFVENKYGISRYDMSENHFFLHIIPKVIVLHGYGDPLLDKHITERVKSLEERNIPSYFSCNPANIDVDKSPTARGARDGSGHS